MIAQSRRTVALLLSIALLFPCLSGCWDNREIDKLAIVTGVALDVAQAPGMVEITIEVANTQGSASSPNTDPGGGGQSAFSMFRATAQTAMGGIMQIDQNSNHKAMPKHNRVRLFGSALCEQGLLDHIDTFMRDQQSRLEVPMLVVEGSAGEALSARVTEEELCGMFLAGMMEDLSQISVAYRVRMIDFMRTILAGTTSAVIPLIKLFKEGDKEELNITGMAVFKGDKMIGRISNDDSLGYIWALKKTKKSNLVLGEGPDMAVLHMPTLGCKRKVTLRPDGGISVALKLKGTANLIELRGFAEMAPKELIPLLEEMGREAIKGKIMGTFESAKALNADIFGFGATVYQRYPRQWKEQGMEANWDALFQDIDLSVEVDLNLFGTGQIVQSLQMEERMQ